MVREKEAVQKYYAGEYSAKVAEVEKRVGSANFQHEIVPVSFTQVNLTSDGNALAQVNAGYDNVTWLRYLESMYNTVYEMLKGGKTWLSREGRNSLVSDSPRVTVRGQRLPIETRWS